VGVIDRIPIRGKCVPRVLFIAGKEISAKMKCGDESDRCCKVICNAEMRAQNCGTPECKARLWVTLLFNTPEELE
jgi:hypothetical protein